jgi:UPF0271 protein
LIEKMQVIDLNCDMGESFGAWKIGDDAGIMPHITSANIACGAHAGDPDVMRNTVRLAMAYGVSVGAHPGYPDLHGFGRRVLPMANDQVINSLLYQIGALAAVCRPEGAELRHVKPHGALYNRACENAELAAAIVDAIWLFSPSLALMALPNSQLEHAAIERGLTFLREGFADRAYEPNGLLRDRKYEDALIKNPSQAAAQAVSLARGSATAHNGAPLQFRVDTICIHGDTPGAAEIVRAVREALGQAGISVAAPTSSNL